MPIHRKPSRMPLTASSTCRSWSVSSIRSRNWPPKCRASSQLNRAVRTPPMCRKPVGLGANRVRTVMGPFRRMRQPIKHRHDLAVFLSSSGSLEKQTPVPKQLGSTAFDALRWLARSDWSATNRVNDREFPRGCQRAEAVRRGPAQSSNGDGGTLLHGDRVVFACLFKPRSRESSPLEACPCGLDDRSGMYRWDRGFSVRRAGGRNLFVAQVAEDLENFAPGGKHPATLVFVLIHGEHELQLRLGVIALARGGVHESPPSTGLSGLGGAGRLLAGAAIRPFRAWDHRSFCAGCCCGLSCGLIHPMSLLISPALGPNWAPSGLPFGEDFILRPQGTMFRSSRGPRFKRLGFKWLGRRLERPHVEQRNSRR